MGQTEVVLVTTVRVHLVTAQHVILCRGRTISSPTKHERIVKSSSSLRGQAFSLALIPAVGKQESQLKWINQYMYRYSVGRPSYLCTKQSN